MVLTQSSQNIVTSTPEGHKKFQLFFKPINIHIFLITAFLNASLFLRTISIYLVAVPMMYEVSLNTLPKYHKRFHVNTT